MGGGEASSSSSNVSNQTTSSWVDSFNTTSNYTQNFSNVGNTSTHTVYGPENNYAGGSSGSMLPIVAMVLAPVILILLLRR